MRGLPARRLQKLRRHLRLRARRPEHDRPAPPVRAQPLRQHLRNLLVPLHPRRDLHHLEFQRRPLHRRLEKPQRFRSRHRLVERADFRQHLALRRRRHIHHRRHRPAHAVPDEPPRIQIIRPEIMPPLRQAVRLVEHPGADLPLPQRLPERLAPQLLRRHVQQRYIAHRNPVQHIAALQRRQQPVQRRRAAARRRRPLPQLVHLILHQRLQRRQHHRQRPAPLHFRQRRKLETQRLPAARRHHRHQRFPGQRHLHHLALQTAPALVPPEILEPREPAPQPLPAVELLPAPCASRIAARTIPQPVGNLPRRGITPPHPARQHRPTVPRHRQPNQHICQPHPPLAVLRNLQLPRRRRTPRPPRALPHRRLDIRRGGRRPAEHQRISLRHPSSPPRAQPVQRPVQNGIVLPQLRQHLRFPPKQLLRQHRIAQRIILLPPRRLVVLLQRVIRILRKTQRRQLQRVHHRQLPQQRHPGKLLRQHPQIVTPHIVPRDRRRPEQRRIQPFLQPAFRLRLLP